MSIEDLAIKKYKAVKRYLKAGTALHANKSIDNRVEWGHAHAAMGKINRELDQAIEAKING